MRFLLLLLVHFSWGASLPSNIPILNNSDGDAQDALLDATFKLRVPENQATDDQISPDHSPWLLFENHTNTNINSQAEVEGEDILKKQVREFTTNVDTDSSDDDDNEDQSESTAVSLTRKEDSQKRNKKSSAYSTRVCIDITGPHQTPYQLCRDSNQRGYGAGSGGNRGYGNSEANQDYGSPYGGSFNGQSMSEYEEGPGPGKYGRHPIGGSSYGGLAMGNNGPEHFPASGYGASEGSGYGKPSYTSSGYGTVGNSLGGQKSRGYGRPGPAGYNNAPLQSQSNYPSNYGAQSSHYGGGHGASHAGSNYGPNHESVKGYSASSSAYGTPPGFGGASFGSNYGQSGKGSVYLAPSGIHGASQPNRPPFSHISGSQYRQNDMNDEDMETLGSNLSQVLAEEDEKIHAARSAYASPQHLSYSPKSNQPYTHSASAYASAPVHASSSHPARVQYDKVISLPKSSCGIPLLFNCQPTIYQGHYVHEHPVSAAASVYGPTVPAPAYSHPAPALSYNHPAPAPIHNYLNPASAYGHSAAPSYGHPAPSAGYKHPAPAPVYGNSRPAPAYGEPAPSYSHSVPMYSAPPPNYSHHSAPSYETSSQSHGQSASLYGGSAPVPGYGALAPSYGHSISSYGSPPSNLYYGPSAPAPSYGAPASHYSHSTPSHGIAPAPTYGEEGQYHLSSSGQKYGSVSYSQDDRKLSSSKSSGYDAPQSSEYHHPSPSYGGSSGGYGEKAFPQPSHSSSNIPSYRVAEEKDQPKNVEGHDKKEELMKQPASLSKVSNSTPEPGNPTTTPEAKSLGSKKLLDNKSKDPESLPAEDSLSQ